MSRQHFTNSYIALIVAAGVAVVAFSASTLQLTRLDQRFFLIALVTIGLGSRLTVKLPKLSSHVSMSDTFIFIIMLLYGGEAAVLVSAAEAFCSSLGFSRKKSTILFNSAVMGCSTFVSAWTLRFCFGQVVNAPPSGYSATYVISLCVLALTQYFVNSSLVSILASIKIDQPLWKTWRKHYLWTSITYFAGASAAGIIANLIASAGFYAFLVTAPIIAIIYFTYQTYLANVEAVSAQAEQSERHVRELSLYLEERQRAEEERDRLFVLEQHARAEAEKANRIKEEFLATLSHELRTPLTSILGWVGLIRQDKLDADTLPRALEVIERQANAQKKLIDDLLDVSRITAGKVSLDVRPVGLKRIIEDSLDAARVGADAKQIHLLTELGNTDYIVSGDQGRLQQVFWNVLTNAIKFTPEGGRICVSLERKENFAQVSISDTGIGIDPKFLPFVFERFSQADARTTRRHSGLGLGLSIVRQIVEMHGGSVGVESAGEGQGATFLICLPLHVCESGTSIENERPVVRRGSTKDHRMPLHALKVLFVDDELDTREMIRTVLERHGAEVRTSSSAAEALAELEQWSPDVLLSDIAMPDEDGYSLIHKIREKERGHDIRAAALTSYSMDEDRQRAIAAGFQMHVAKPVGTMELVNAVARLAAAG